MTQGRNRIQSSLIMSFQENHKSLLLSLLTTCLCLSLHQSSGLAASEADAYTFNDFPLEEPLHYPDWFKQSFLYLGDDLQEAVDAGKKGIIVYFGQKRCAYCRMLMDVNFGLPDVVEYTRRHFDVIPIDIWGVAEVTDVEGETLTEREFALRERTNFTPSLVFYDQQGREALRLRGYYPPYQFRAALEYVADDHYRRESFPEYLARADDAMKFEPGDLNEEDFFSPPPHMLDRSRVAAQRPLVVFFEQGDCHACDVLHGDPLRDPSIHRIFRRLDDVQLDMWSDTPVITPDGRRTTARRWARELGLFYAPSLLFFDEHGEEILRVDSVVRFYRLKNVLDYIESRAYLSEPSYQRWRVSRNN
jgi:thioredoxin-related protein